MLGGNAVSGGESLDASATRQRATIEVTITTRSVASWIQADAEAVSNAVISSVGILEPDRSVLVTLVPTDPELDRASFRFRGLLAGYRNGVRCDVSRVFEVLTAGGEVRVQRADRLPLGARQSARIVVVSRRGRVVELQAQSAFTGHKTSRWRVSGGSQERLGEAGLRWELPAEPGIYQVQLVMDYGNEGLAFDALALEVSSS